MSPGVQVAWPSVRRALLGGKPWLCLKPRTGTPAGFNQAMWATNADREEFEDEGYGTMTAWIPDGYVVKLDRLGEEEHLRAWVHTFADHLTARGFSGTLAPATPARLPTWVEQYPPVLTAYLGWSLDLDAMTAADRVPRSSWWWVPGDVSDLIVDHTLDWLEPERGLVHLRSGLGITVTGREIIESQLRPTLHGQGLPSFGATVLTEGEARDVSFSSGGEERLQVIGSLPWTEVLARLRAALTTLPQHLALGFVRMARPLTPSWHHADGVQPLPTSLDMYHIIDNKHLLADYVPDAHGIQVLTERHLSHARDLSAWTLTELTRHRYLVEAKDLEPWYGHTVMTPEHIADRHTYPGRPRQGWYDQFLPSPEVLDRARHDFGDMILTPETVKAHPPPWKPPRPTT